MTNYATAFVGLGSNLDNPAQQLRQALQQLAAIKDSRNLRCSPWYGSKAIGPGNQPDYINAVAELETQLSPLELLRELQAIENAHGRQRQIRWGARTLDLDLLLYDKQIIHTEVLQLPHPEMINRAFVLVPLYDLAPTLCLPNGDRLKNKIAAIDDSELYPIIEASVANKQ